MHKTTFLSLFIHYELIYIVINCTITTIPQSVYLLINISHRIKLIKLHYKILRNIYLKFMIFLR